MVRVRAALASFLASVGLLFAIACGSSSAASVTSPATASGHSASPSPAATSPLDPAVALPSDFPKDFPVYPEARATYFGGDSSFGTTTYGIRWETTDSIDQAYRWYQTQLSQGDWKITTSGTDAVNGDTIGFVRRSNSTKTGDLAISERSLGVTQIGLTLVL